MKQAMYLFLALVMVISVAAIPGQPQQFFGTVTLNGHPAPDGLLIETYNNGHATGDATVTKDGKYGYEPLFYVRNDDGTVSGDIVFYIQGVNTGIHASFLPDLGPQQVDLSLTGNYFCGDFVCGGSETCSNCAKDCGTCSSSSGGSSGGGSSGGGGGGFSYPTTTTTMNDNETAENTTTTTLAQRSGDACTPDWMCSAWSVCATGKQTRVCVDKNNCNTDEGKPITEQSCEIKKTLTEGNQSVNSQSLAAQQGDNETLQTAGNAVTGAVTGPRKTALSSWILPLIAIVLLGVVLFLYLRKRQEEKN